MNLIKVLSILILLLSSIHGVSAQKKKKRTSHRNQNIVQIIDDHKDLVEEKQTLKNKDYVWKGYDRLMEISNENK